MSATKTVIPNGEQWTLPGQVGPSGAPCTFYIYIPTVFAGVAADWAGALALLKAGKAISGYVNTPTTGGGMTQQTGGSGSSFSPGPPPGDTSV